jgi:hypothetical protein
MKIFLSFLQGKPNHPVPAYSFWEYYIKNGITEAGYEWAECNEVDWAEGLVYQNGGELLDSWKAYSWDKTIAYLKKNKVDLFLSYLYPYQVDEQAIKQIQALGIPCVNYFCDNVREFTSVPKSYQPFDLHWVPEYKALSLYKKAGLNFLNLPMPVWVKPEQRTLVYEEKYQPTFVGSIDIQRAALFQNVLKKYPHVTLRGPGWLNEKKQVQKKIKLKTKLELLQNQIDFIGKNGLKSYFYKFYNQYQKPIIDFDFLKAFVADKAFDEAYFEVSKNAIITIGVNRYPSFRHSVLRPDTYSRLRDIEATMLGACYLTEATAGLDLLYEIDKEIKVYGDEDEMIEKIKFLIAHPEQRKKLRAQGQKKALNELGIPQSLKQIVNSFNLKN